MPYLKKDEYSQLNPANQYGKAGDEVIVTGEHGSVLIVKPKAGGLGFWVLPKDLSDEPFTPSPDAPDTEQLEPKKIAAVRRPRRSQPTPSPGLGPIPGQGSLF